MTNPPFLHLSLVMPASAGTPRYEERDCGALVTGPTVNSSCPQPDLLGGPAFAGMTNWGAGMTRSRNFAPWRAGNRGDWRAFSYQ